MKGQKNSKCFMFGLEQRTVYVRGSYYFQWGLLAPHLQYCALDSRPQLAIRQHTNCEPFQEIDSSIFYRQHQNIAVLSLVSMDTQVGAGEPRTLGPLAYPSILVEHDDVFDGRSLYRALARQHTGNPSNFLNVMNGVLDLYLRIWANPIHQDKDQIRILDNLNCGRLKTFFNALACPDNIELELYDQVVGFIADALNVRISTFTWSDEGGLRCVSDLGKSFVPSYDIWRRQETCRYEDGFEERLFVFHSLLADESGTPLMIYLEKQKIAMDGESRGRTQTTRYNGLQLKKLCWWWRTDENQDAFDKRPDDAYGSVRHPKIHQDLQLTVT